MLFEKKKYYAALNYALMLNDQEDLSLCYEGLGDIHRAHSICPNNSEFKDRFSLLLHLTRDTNHTALSEYLRANYQGAEEIFKHSPDLSNIVSALVCMIKASNSSGAWQYFKDNFIGDDEIGPFLETCLYCSIQHGDFQPSLFANDDNKIHVFNSFLNNSLSKTRFKASEDTYLTYPRSSDAAFQMVYEFCRLAFLKKSKVNVSIQNFQYIQQTLLSGSRQGKLLSFLYYIYFGEYPRAYSILQPLIILNPSIYKICAPFLSYLNPNGNSLNWNVIG